VSNFVLSPIFERRLIAAGMISIVIIIMSAYLSNNAQPTPEFANWKLRSSFHPLSLPEAPKAHQHQDSTVDDYWDEE